jgi:hypothetical protein
VTKTLYLVSAALFASAALAPGATPLDVKTGEWETSMTSESTGPLPIPQEVLDKMSPEQRARMEQAMKARSAKGPRTITERSCVRKETLENPFNSSEERSSCKQTVVASTRTTQEIHMECEADGGKQSGTFRLQAVDSGNVKGTVQITAANGSRTMNINNTFAARWIGPTCSEKAK